MKESFSHTSWVEAPNPAKALATEYAEHFARSVGSESFQRWWLHDHKEYPERYLGLIGEAIDNVSDHIDRASEEGANVAQFIQGFVERSLSSLLLLGLRSREDQDQIVERFRNGRLQKLLGVCALSGANSLVFDFLSSRSDVGDEINQYVAQLLNPDANTSSRALLDGLVQRRAQMNETFVDNAEHLELAMDGYDSTIKRLLA
jgi:hypothetical protein